MEHVLQWYSKNGVGYVELSVSTKDLTNPWVYKHLVEPIRKYNDVKVYFLAAFPRNDKAVPKIPGKDERVKWIKILQGIAKHKLSDEESYQNYVKPFSGALAGLKAAVDSSKVSHNTLP